MPNWCVGALKVRGEKENIKKFLTGAFEPIVPRIAVLHGLLNSSDSELSVEEDKYGLTIKANKECDGLHIKGTRRNYIESTSIEWEFDQKVLVIHEFHAAWGIDAQALVNLSKEYEIDLKIYAFERGMEYNVDFEVHKGEVIKYNEIKFEDYDWECIFPNLGG